MREIIDGVDWPAVGDILRGGIEGGVWYVALFTLFGGAIHACG